MSTAQSIHGRKLLLTLALTPLLALPAAAEEQQAAQQAAEKQYITQTAEDIVVTASRSETSIEETTKSIDVVDAADREDLQQYFLPELLDNEPGVILRSLGGLGQWSNLSIRGDRKSVV